MQSSKTLILAGLFLATVVAAGLWMSVTSEPVYEPDVVEQVMLEEVRPKQPQVGLEEAGRKQDAHPIAQTERSTADEMTAAQETEIVEGIEVLKNRKCTIKVHYLDNGDGTTKKLHSCVPNNKAPRDIYETYSDETLETMAYSDAKAAQVLSLRVLQSDIQKGMDLAFRATALSGESLPILAAMRRFPVPLVFNDAVQVEGVTNQYVMSGVLKELGLDHSTYNNRRLSVLDLQNEGVDINSLDIRIKEIVAEIGNIRNEVGVEISSD